MLVNQIVGSITSGPRAVFARYNTSSSWMKKQMVRGKASSRYVQVI